MLGDVCHLLSFAQHLNLLLLLLGKLHEVVKYIFFFCGLGTLLDIFCKATFSIVEVNAIL